MIVLKSQIQHQYSFIGNILFSLLILHLSFACSKRQISSNVGKDAKCSCHVFLGLEDDPCINDACFLAWDTLGNSSLA